MSKKKQVVMIGKLGDGAGRIDVPGKPNHVFVTLEVINQRVFPETLEKLVLVGTDPIHFPGVVQVLGIAPQIEACVAAEDERECYDHLGNLWKGDRLIRPTSVEITGAHFWCIVCQAVRPYTVGFIGSVELGGFQCDSHPRADNPPADQGAGE